MKQDIPRPMIVAQVKIASGSSLHAISRSLGYSENWLAQALDKPFPRAEKVISDIIGVPVIEIWPSRFNPDGSRKDKRIRRKITTGHASKQA